MLVSEMLDQSDMQSDPAAVAQELGLTFDGEQDWTFTKLWAFTMRDQSNPYAGVTFYTPPGATRDQIIQRWNEKKAEFGEGSGIGNAR